MNEDIRALIDYRMEEAHDALEEATILLHSRKARGALNRVYYAMFYAVLALLASRQMSASKHSRAIALFHREFVKKGVIPVEVAKFLDIAFDLRNKSDYQDFVEPELKRVEELREAAVQFIGAIETGLRPPYCTHLPSNII